MACTKAWPVVVLVDAARWMSVLLPQFDRGESEGMSRSAYRLATILTLLTGAHERSAIAQRPAAEVVSFGGVPVSVGDDSATVLPMLRARCGLKQGTPTFYWIGLSQKPERPIDCEGTLELSGSRITAINQDWPVGASDQYSFSVTMIRALSTILEPDAQAGQSRNSVCLVETVQISQPSMSGRSLVVHCGNHAVEIDAVDSPGSSHTVAIRRATIRP
jgi:hypothetical protein